jgi:NHLM bacteriocin system ABC transporter ATP-binding protein
MAIELFANQGESMQSGSHRPIALMDPDALWLVEAGMLDIFAVPTENGQPAGMRIHLLRVDVGEVVFGLRSPAETAGLVFIAVGGVETQVRKMSLAALKPGLREPENLRQMAPLVDIWIRGLFAGVSKHLAPQRFISLIPGQEARIQPGEMGCPLDMTVWIQVRQGSVRMTGLNELSFTASPRHIPVTPVSWIDAAEETVVQCTNTLDALRDEPVEFVLADCGQILARWVAINQRQFESAETSRLQSKEADKQHAMSSAIRRMQGILGGADRVAGPVEAEPDPLLAACQIVGRAMGIEFKPLSKASGAMGAKDPLLRLAEASRLRLRRVVLAGNWWEHDNGPLLGYLEADGRPVALLPKGSRAYEMCDPADGSRTLVTSQKAELLKSMAFSFFRSFPDRALKTMDIIRFGLTGAWPDIITIMLVGIAGALLNLLTPVATGVIFDSIVPAAQRSQLLQMTMGLFVAALGVLTFEVTRSVALLRAESRSNSIIEAAIWDRLLLLPIPFFRKFSAGDLALRANGINNIRQHLSHVVMGSLLSGVFSLFNLALLFYYSTKLALVATGLVLVCIAVTGLSSLFTLKYSRQALDVQGKISGLVLQLVTGISKLRVAGAERQAFAQWAHAFTQEKRLHLRSQTISNGFGVFNTVFPTLSSICLFGAIAFYLKEQIPTGSFLAFNAAWGAFLGAMLGMTSSLLSTLEIIPLYQRTKPILETAPEIDFSKTDPGVLTGRIEFSHVMFRYTEDGPIVLDDLSFEIRAGEFVAVVGPSGSGKSTLLRLLLGFEAPESGALFFDGLDQACLDIAAVRKQLGVVLQNGKLIPGSIYDNIVGASTLTLDDAWEAARKAGLAEDIENMPMGMHTVLSEGEGTISGGQRQRLMIARAIVSRPRIVLFDEATSALDNPTQAIVSRSLEQLQATRVVIAHRLSTIVHANRILVMQNGKLIQNGDYETLLRQPGLFASLAKRQLV